MEDFGQPSPATNGQEAMPSVEASVPFDTSFDAPERPRRQQAPMPDLPKVQGMAPSTGFGILEQILLELTACNLELRALRQTLSNPQATGPSVLASPAGAQASSQPTLPASGDASPTADAPARPRRRGRPPATPTKKEGDEFGLE